MLSRTDEITDYKFWDDFVEQSPQGTIFSKTEWMKLMPDSFKIYGCWKGSEFIGGIAGFVKDGDEFISGGYPFTPYQGIIIKNAPDMKYASLLSLYSEVANGIIDILVYPRKTIINHFTYSDIRPFIWANWKPIVKYTYLVDMSNSHLIWQGMDKDTRNLITKGMRGDIDVTFGDRWLPQFWELYNTTFESKGVSGQAPLDLIMHLPNRKVYTAWGNDGLSASAITVYDARRTYYMFAASEPKYHGDGASSYLLWQILQENEGREVDLVGCNIPEISLFKSGFGGKLIPYMGAYV